MRRSGRAVTAAVLICGTIGATGIGLGAGASPALAASHPVTVQFNFADQQESWIVPEGVSSITVTAAGASGYDYSDASEWGSRAGGSGGIVVAELPVTPGSELLLLAGYRPTGGWVPTPGNSPESSHFAGGGGSFLATEADGILVAAGGGGGASRLWEETAANAAGGDAGFAQAEAGGPTPEYGGTGATSTAPGVNSAIDDQWLSPPAALPAHVRDGVIVPGYGGTSQINIPAGGGGGYYGGGAGGFDFSRPLSGSGGGGSGYLASSGTLLSTAFNRGNGYLTIEYEAVAPTITGAATAQAVIGEPFSYAPTITGAPTPTVTLTAGEVPAGLELDPVSGAISGTPTGPAGQYPVTLTAQNMGELRESLDLTITVKDIEVTVAFDSNGHGAAPAPATVERGTAIAEPADLSAEGWVFTGWYTDAATTAAYDFTAPVMEDLTLYAGWAAYTEAPTIAGPATVAATVGEPFEYKPILTGVPAPTVALTTGELPAGLHLDPATGVISGTPMALVGDSDVVLSASNGVGTDSSLDVTLSLEAGEIASVTVTPSATTVKQKGTIDVAASGADAAGNPVAIPTEDIQYRSSVSSDTIRGSSITFPTASSHVITWEHLPSKITGEFAVEVNRLPVESSELPEEVTHPPIARDELPVTGGELGAGPWIAVGLALVGAAALVVARRRPRDSGHF